MRMRRAGRSYLPWRAHQFVARSLFFDERLKKSNGAPKICDANARYGYSKQYVYKTMMRYIIGCGEREGGRHLLLFFFSLACCLYLMSLEEDALCVQSLPTVWCLPSPLEAISQRIDVATH